jgi:hypothetical protein
MRYTLPGEPPFPVDVYAADRVAMASQFRVDVIIRYQQNYEKFWGLDREELGSAEMQGILDRLGPAAMEILADAALYVGGLVAAFPGELPARYHEAPYAYTVTPEGRIVLEALKEEWVTAEDEETE